MVAVNMIELLKTWMMSFGIKLFAGLFILIIGFKIVNIIDYRLNRGKNFIKIDPTLKSFLSSAMRMGLKALVIVTAIVQVGIPMTSFVALIGAAGLAVGLALQGSLSNLAGGVLIIFLRPFRVGDYIEGNGHSGTVRDIGLFYTHLTTPDNKAVIIPNSGLANSSLINYSEHSERRVDFNFGVSYDSDIKTVKRVILEVIERNALILKTPDPFVRLASHGASSLDFTVRVWVAAENYWDVFFTIQEDVKEAFDEAGIEIPYPHMVLQTQALDQKPMSNKI
ncbi:mechanosensitive ion channel family protein [Fusibacter sp. 3D3]|uniref:mechanosensitive ion channel family protein n=1 Tax=Fusibacter sp. 3D3 TaxID=1048380 RepID=UPI00085368A6|nr:mechanosensitive ion channel domain-containing protein [Fusibacter sp. 3D3]GAU76055.1 small-conductance mechanosensitive channel [Fusibacter sp. 3D3]